VADQPLAPLLERLFPAEAEPAARIALARQCAEPSGWQAITPIPGCEAWPAVRAVLLQAVAEKRPTLVYGDYDVDGICATALLFRWLRSQGVPGNTFLPSRQLHGYGLDLKIVQQAIDHGYRTLVALDCGTADHQAINLAWQAGLSVAVIDHHEPQGPLPVPLLNPHLEPSLPPCCTAGLVACVLAALQHDAPGSLAGDELELAGLATLADIVPLVPLNWTLAHAGLEALPETVNHGLRALIVYSGLDGLDALTPRQAQFSLIPRLNAAGRLRTPRIALDLLLAANQTEARQAAQLLERLNTERQDLSKQVARQAVLAALEQPEASGVAVYHPDWHIGVLGIVAAQVAGQLGKPAIILTDAPGGAAGQDRLLSGSARSAGGVDIIAALQECAETLSGFGGHAAAAGLKVRLDALVEFQAAWSTAVAAQQERQAVLAPAPVLHPIPARLTDLTDKVEQAVWELQPFGPGFEPAPVVLEGCRVERANLMGRDKTHLALNVTDGERSVRLTGFNCSHLYPQLRPGQAIRPILTLEADNYQNRRTIMLRLLGIE
jgi:single-stranded-DNA-specific exonuclease